MYLYSICIVGADKPDLGRFGEYSFAGPLYAGPVYF